MRKWIPAIVVTAIVLAIFIYSQFTNPNTLWIEPLSDADRDHVANAISEQYKGVGIFSFGHDPYYGTINSCTIVRTEKIDTLSMEWYGWGRFEAAGYVFYWINPLNLFAYHDGEVCRLDEAFEKGWLSKEQIGVIYEKHQENISLLPMSTQEAIKEWVKEIEAERQSK